MTPRPISYALFTAVLLGVALRLTALDVHSLWYDEAATVYQAQHPTPYELLKSDRHPPLSFYAFRFWIAAFGQSDATLRLLPALLSGLSLCFFARVASALLVGLPLVFAVGLYAVSPFHLWHGQEVRMYVFLECGALLATAGFLMALRSRRVILGCALTSLGLTFAMLSHYFGVLAIPALAAALLVEWFRSRITTSRAIGIGSALLLPFLIAAPIFLSLIPAQTGTDWAWQSKVSLRDWIEFPIRQVLVAGATLPPVARSAGYALAALLLLGFALGFLRALRRPTFESLFIAALFSAPVLADLALSLINPLSLTPKYLMVASSGTVLLIAQGIAGWPMRRGALRTLRMCAVASIFAGTLSYAFWLRSDNQREDYRYAAQCVINNWEPGDLILVVSGTYRAWSEAPVRHYLRDYPEMLASVVDSSLVVDASSPWVRDRTRVHVIYRSAAYADEAMRRARRLGRVVVEEPERLRIQYLQLSLAAAR